MFEDGGGDWPCRTLSYTDDALKVRPVHRSQGSQRYRGHAPARQNTTHWGVPGIKQLVDYYKAIMYYM